MSAPKGNQFWKNVDPANLGRPPRYSTPEDLWNDVVKYFEQCDETPLIRRECTVSDKGTFDKTIEHKIPYTWEGLYVFLEVCNLDHYRTKKEFSGILTHIGNIIRNQKYSGAVAGIFNANIVARDLHLSDNVNNSNVNYNTQELTSEQIEKLIDKL